MINDAGLSSNLFPAVDETDTQFGSDTEKENIERFSIEEYKKHGAWSEFLEKAFSETAALSFAVGSDILLDHIQEDMNRLSSMPAG